MTLVAVHIFIIQLLDKEKMYSFYLRYCHKIFFDCTQCTLPIQCTVQYRNTNMSCCTQCVLGVCEFLELVELNEHCRRKLKI